MFTGIIKAVAKIENKQLKNGGLFLVIQKPKSWKIKAGDSICTSGACLTVKSVGKSNYIVELMPETLAKTYFGQDSCQDVNLERPLKFGDVLDGHLVAGHVDAVGKILKITKRGATAVFKITVKKKFAKYLAEKGSVAVDGVSLTVVNSGANWFTVSVVDYTLKNTILGAKKINNPVHLEFDIMAKYLEKLIHKKLYATKPDK